MTTTTFYATAHPDDWQLFLTPNAIDDVLDGNNITVFIGITAGDAGNGWAGAPSPIGGVPYAQTREEGNKRSLRFISALPGQFTQFPVESTATFNGHQLATYTIGNTVAYFFRLVDGNVDGSGFAGTGHQSLLRLHDGAIPSMSALDGSTTYNSWNDLVTTLRSIIESESANATTVWINTQDPDPNTNPGDHQDHYMTGTAMQDALSNLPTVNQALFQDYSKGPLPENLSPQDSRRQAATFAAYITSMVDAGFGSLYMGEGENNGWLGKQYYRTIAGSGG